MTTKKSKPASLTSSLLARKGEAEPATAPYTIPEVGGRHPGETVPGKGNGNGSGVGGDLATALSGMARATPSGKAASTVTGENGAHTEAVRPAEPSEGRDALTAPEAAPETISDNDVQLSPQNASPEEIFLESAVAEEASVDEAIIGASISDGVAEPRATVAGASEETTPPTSTDAAEAAAPPGPGAPESDSKEDTREADGDADREAARDARLLRFVYAMAALTGIVAIVLYAGGWLRDVPEQQRGNVSVAVESPTAVSEPQSSADAPTSAPGSESVSTLPEGGNASPVIPVAPPVAPPSSAGAPDVGKSAMPETGVTTGGMAEQTAATPAAPPSGALPETTTASPTQSAGTAPPTGIGAPSTAEPSTSAAADPSTPSATDSASSDSAKVDISGAVPTVESAKSAAPAAATANLGENRGSSADAQPVVPTPIAPETAPAPPVAGSVRDVPNLRVLAPALGRPEPAETAPPVSPQSVRDSAASVPSLNVPPAEPQTAALPKSAAQKLADRSTSGAGTGPFLVQLSSVSAETVAKREWARLQKVFPDVFGNRTLAIEKKVIAGRGTFFRVQTGGFATIDEARAVCASLKAKKQGCLPIKR